MGGLTKPRIANLTVATGAAILTALPRSLEARSNTAIYSEAVCWALVLTSTELVQRSPHLGWGYNDVIPAPPQAHLPWVFAACTAATAMLSSVDDVTWTLPAIVPILAILRNTTYLPRLAQSTAEHLQSRYICVGVGLASVLALAHSYSLSSICFGSVALLSHAAIYTMLIRVYEMDAAYLGKTSDTALVPVLKKLASRTAGISTLVGVIVLLGWTTGAVPLFQIFGIGLIKAINWSLMFWIAQTEPWELAPLISTFAAGSASIATSSASEPLHALKLFAGLFVALSALSMSISCLPKSTAGRNVLLIFAFWPLWSFFSDLSLSGGLGFLPGVRNHGPAPGSAHPIEELIVRAQNNFDGLVRKQSTTLKMAEQEYRRRYSFEPPTGFDKWFAYAQSKKSVILDDYDMINDDLRPFWRISPQRLLESIDYVTSFEHLALRKCGFTNGEYHGQGGGWIVDDLGHKLLEEVRHDIPDVEFAFDVVDEPRVIITEQMLAAGSVAKPEFHNAEHKSIWSQATAPCQNQSTKKYTPGVYDYGIPFVQDWYQAKDVCQHPEFAEMHGFFASPETCILTDAPIPVLSQAAPTTFGDIMYPSPWYPAKADQGVYKPEHDPSWENKTSTLYWAGSTTGSHSWNGSWKLSQRQRFVQLVQTLNDTSHRYLKQDPPASWKEYMAIEDHSALYDVKLTGIIQCEEADCKEQEGYFKVHDKEDREQQFKSRFVFDLDGNSFSGRYYTLLRSNSVVLKQTVLREWHDERLIPWVHYVPISMSMQELPEVMKFLTSERGEKLAERIAENSKKAHATMLRPVDMTVYLYRLMLELARVMDPNRKQIDV